jgi:hypothetical protein
MNPFYTLVADRAAHRCEFGRVTIAGLEMNSHSYVRSLASHSLSLSGIHRFTSTI